MVPSSSVSCWRRRKRRRREEEENLCISVLLELAYTLLLSI